MLIMDSRASDDTAIKPFRCSEGIGSMTQDPYGELAGAKSDGLWRAWSILSAGDPEGSRSLASRVAMV